MLAITRAALAALAALPPGAGALVGYGEGGASVVVGAHASSDPSALAALLPPPLRVLGRIGAGPPAPGDALAAAPPAAPGGAPTFTAPGGGAAIEPEVLDHDPLERDHVLVRCVVDAVLEAAEGAGGADAAAAALDALEARLCGAGAAFLVDDAAAGGAAVADAQLLSTLAGGGAPVTLRAACRAPAAAAPAAPVAAFEPAEGGVATAAARLDALCFAPRAGTAAEAGALARRALAAQLAAARAELSTADGGLAPLTALHFRPPGFCHHVTALYPLPPAGGADAAAEAALAPRRAALHAALGLPADRPLLRAANALSFAEGGGGGAGGATGGAGVGGRPRLRDVHAGLPRAGVAGGSLHLVQVCGLFPPTLAFRDLAF
jgi:nicotinate-nucleotide--dimethylbenzimidazole phosphoribosyltransferase